MKLSVLKVFRIVFFIGFCASWLIVWGESLVPGGQSKEHSDFIAGALIDAGGSDIVSKIEAIKPEKVEAIDSLTLLVGDTYKIEPTVFPDNTTDKSIKYTVNKTSLISVNSEGVITALSPGNARIVVASKNYSHIYTIINVSIIEEEIKYPDSITLERVEPSEQDNLNIVVGEEIRYRIVPSNNADAMGEIIWKSLDSSKISIVSYDEQFITVKAHEIVNEVSVKAVARTDASVNFKFDFMISGIQCERIEIDEIDLTSYYGMLTVSYYPDNTTETSVTFSSSDESVIRVYSYGYYTITGTGSATVTATLTNNSDISVTKELNIEKIEPVMIRFPTRSVRLNEQFELVPNYSPSYATPLPFTIESELLEHVEGNYYRPIKKGYETVIITFPDLNEQYRLNLTVVDEDAILQEKVVIDSYPERIVVGTTDSQVIAHVEPTNATNQRAAFEPSDTDILSIDANGMITAKKTGTTYIYAFARDSYNIYERVLVTVVYPPVEYFEIVLDDEYYYGEEVPFILKTTPENASYQKFSYQFDDSTIASLENDIMLFKGIGTVTLTVTCDDITKTKVINVKNLDDIILEFRNSEGNAVSPTSLIVDEIYTMSYMASGEEVFLSPKIVNIQSGRNVIINGNVAQPLSLGAYYIYIYDIKNKELIHRTKVKNIDIPVEHIAIDGPSTLTSGESVELSCSILPLSIRDKGVIWSVSDQSAASITSEGVFTALKKGKVTITATLKQDQTVKATFEIDIDWVIPTDISFSTLENMTVGDTATIYINVTPLDVTNMTIEYEASNDCVVITDDGTITALKKGTTTITATLSEDKSIVFSQQIEVEGRGLLGKFGLETFYRMVRKGIGHFGAFFILAACLFLTLILRENKKLWKIVVFTIPSVLLIAVVAELLQMMTQGRFCTVSDMLINFSGGATAIIFLTLGYLLVIVIKKIKNKKGATS